MRRLNCVDDEAVTGDAGVSDTAEEEQIRQWIVSLVTPMVMGKLMH